MKKHMIAFMLCLAMVVASISGSSVLAAETNGEAGITEGSVAETADDEADDDETTVAEITADDDEAAIDETAVVEITDAAAADDEAAAAETTDDEAADGEATAAETAADENVVQAIWTRGNSTITFYYGPTVEEGDYFGEETVTNVWVGDDVVTSHGWLFDNSIKDVIMTAVFDASFQAVSLSSLRGWFNKCFNLQYLDFRGLDTSGVTDMSYMFNGCCWMCSLDLSGFDTSNVTDMNNMFRDCDELMSLDISSFDTSKVTNMNNMFGSCSELTSLDVSGFDTSNVTDMAGMFSGCESLTELDLTGFNTSAVTDMQFMFGGCHELEFPDISGFDTSNVTNMYSMFSGCESLTKLDLSSFDTSNVTNMTYMFRGCENLAELDLSSFDTSNVTDYYEMFGSCKNLTTIYCADSYTKWNWADSTDIFTECRSLVGKDRRFVIDHNNNNKASMARSAYLGGYFTPKHSTFVLRKTTRGDIFNLADNVKVTWKEVPGAEYYKVYREGVTDPSESMSEPVIVTTRLVGWDKQPGLTNGHTYRYRIVASLTGKGDASGDSPRSYSKLMYRLKTVAIRSVKNTAPGKVTVKYDKSPSGDSYVLLRSERQDMVGAKTKVIHGADNTSFVIGGLKKGKTYYISIRTRKKVNGIYYYTTFGVPKKVVVTQ